MHHLNIFGSNSKLDHVGLLVSDIEKVSTSLDIVDDLYQKVRIAFVVINGVNYELIEPFVDSPLNSLLKRGIHTYHTCFSVPSIADALVTAKTYGFRPIDSIVNAPALESRSIQWLASRTFGLFELVEG